MPNTTQTAQADTIQIDGITYHRFKSRFVRIEIIKNHLFRIPPYVSRTSDGWYVKIPSKKIDEFFPDSPGNRSLYATMTKSFRNATNFLKKIGEFTRTKQ